MASKYTLNDDGRRLATGGPTIMQYYGPVWTIVSTDDPKWDAVIVPDRGDGIAGPLAKTILDSLNFDLEAESSSASDSTEYGGS